MLLRMIASGIVGYIVGLVSGVLVVGFMVGACGPDSPEKQKQDLEEMQIIDKRI